MALSFQDKIRQREEKDSSKKELSFSDRVRPRVVAPEPIEPEKESLFKTFGRALVKPTATLIARPVQLGMALGGRTAEEQKISLPFLGDIEAPRSRKGVIRDVGRGLETVSLGLGTSALRGGKLLKESAKIGAVGGFGAGLAEKGSIKDAALGGAIGAGLGAGVTAAVPAIQKTVPSVQALLGKSGGQKQGRKVVEDTFREIATKYQVAGKNLENAEKISKTKPLEVISSYGDKIPKLIQESMEGGKINSGEAVDFLRNRIGTISNIKTDVVKSTDEVVDVASYRAKAIKVIDDQKWSQNKKAQSRAQANKFFDNLEEIYPEGSVPLDEVDLIKTEETSLSKSYNNPGKNAFEYDTHGIIGRASREIVEDITDDDLVKELNKLTQSHYDAIEILRNLRGKTPKGGLMRKMMTQLGGSTAGSIAGLGAGHPILGAIAGRVGADLVFDILGNQIISNPLKKQMIKNLTTVEPDVIKKALEFIELSKKGVLPKIKQNQRSVPKTQLNKANPTQVTNTAKNTAAIPKSNRTLPKKSSK